VTTSPNRPDTHRVPIVLYVRALIWPAVVVVGVFGYSGSQLGSLLTQRRVKNVEAAGVKVELEQVAEVHQDDPAVRASRPGFVPPHRGVQAAGANGLIFYSGQRNAYAPGWYSSQVFPEAAGKVGVPRLVLVTSATSTPPYWSPKASMWSPSPQPSGTGQRRSGGPTPMARRTARRASARLTMLLLVARRWYRSRNRASDLGLSTFPNRLI
jgi:hypothetical protein